MVGLRRNENIFIKMIFCLVCLVVYFMVIFMLWLSIVLCYGEMYDNDGFKFGFK